MDSLIRSHYHLLRYAKNAFQFEEEFLFPALVSGSRTARCKRLISDLQSEHVAIMMKLKESKRLLDQNTFNTSNRDMELRLKMLIESIVASLDDHAAKEDSELLPLLRECGRS